MSKKRPTLPYMLQQAWEIHRTEPTPERRLHCWEEFRHDISPEHIITLGSGTIGQKCSIGLILAPHLPKERRQRGKTTPYPSTDDAQQSAVYHLGDLLTIRLGQVTSDPTDSIIAIDLKQDGSFLLKLLAHQRPHPLTKKACGRAKIDRDIGQGEGTKGGLNSALDIDQGSFSCFGDSFDSQLDHLRQLDVRSEEEQLLAGVAMSGRFQLELIDCNQQTHCVVLVKGGDSSFYIEHPNADDGAAPPMVAAVATEFQEPSPEMESGLLIALHIGKLVDLDDTALGMRLVHDLSSRKLAIIAEPSELDFGGQKSLLGVDFYVAILESEGVRFRMGCVAKARYELFRVERDTYDKLIPIGLPKTKELKSQQLTGTDGADLMKRKEAADSPEACTTSPAKHRKLHHGSRRRGLRSSTADVVPR